MSSRFRTPEGSCTPQSSIFFVSDRPHAFAYRCVRASVAALALTVGCEQATGPSVDNVPPPSAVELRIITQGPAEPGKQIEVEYNGAGRPDARLVLWIDHTSDAAVIYPLVLPLVDAPSAPNRIRVLVPPLPAGRHTLALGTADEGPLSATRELVIAKMVPRYSKQQMATLLGEGLAGTGEFVLARLENPATRDFFHRGMGANNLASLSTWLSEVRLFGDMVRDEYMALDSDSEAQFQAYLFNTGLIQFFEGLAQSTPVPSLLSRAASMPSQGLGLEYPHLHHLTLASIDVFEASLTAVKAFADAATIVSLFTPGTAPIAAISGGLSLGIDAVRTGIKVLIPTEFVSLTPHHQTRVMECQPFQELWWGHMRPQETVGQGTVSFAMTVLAKFKLDLMFPAKGASGTAANKAYEVWLKSVAKVMAKVQQYMGKKMILSVESVVGGYVWQAQVVVNPGLYRIALSDFIPLTMGPVGVFAYPIIRKMVQAAVRTLGLPEHEFFTPVSVSPGFDLYATYSTDTYSLTKTGRDLAAPKSATLTGSVFSFTSVDAIIITVPMPQTPVRASHDVIVEPGPSPCPNVINALQIPGQAMLYDYVELRSDKDRQRDWITSFESPEEFGPYTVTISDGLFPFCALVPKYEIRYSIVVNGQERVRNQILGAGFKTHTVDLKPGRNDVSVTAQSNCGVAPGDPEKRTVWLKVAFPGAFNVFQRSDLIVTPGKLAAGSIVVWTPPVVPK